MIRLYYVRIIAIAVIATVAGVATINLTADIISPRSLRSSNLSTDYAAGQIDAGCQAAKIGVLRSNLVVDCAMARFSAARRASGDKIADYTEQAQSDVSRALSGSPHESKLWLALAVLRDRLGKPYSEPLILSYLTGPSAVDLVPLRIATVVKGNALEGSDLKDFATGDIRLITRAHSELKGALIDAYKNASPLGAAFIEDRLRLIAPEFLNSLAGLR